MTDLLLSKNPEFILPGGGLLPDNNNPTAAVAGLPTTLIAVALDRQLSAKPAVRNTIDYLGTILDSVQLLRNRYEGDTDTLSALNASVSAILGRVVSALQDELGADLSQLGLDTESISYQDDVLELYRFMVINRLVNGREIIYQSIVTSRRRLMERYRRGVEKRNQTVAEARRVFSAFEDVVIWISIPQIITDMHNESNWSYDLYECLQLLDAPESTFLSRLAGLRPDDNFAIMYCDPALDEENAANTVMVIQDQWMNTAEKKSTNQAEQAE